jgi:response regulator RpfG family c-di-GMP phosphodiesterase
MGMPFWKKPWAIIAFLLLLTFIISIISKIINHRKLMRLQARNDWLEHELKIKTESLLEAKKRETTSALTVTLSDKIAQPLMRIQGNIDLINQAKSMPGSIFRNIVSEIQQSIHRINRVMKKLRELESVQFDEYTPGISMISLDDRPREIDTGQGGILFVDDEDSLLDVWNAYFSTLGYRVFIGHSVEEAMDILHESSDHIQVIVSDNKMPGKTGYDFLVEMQEHGYNHPFFILTGFSVEPQLKEMLSKGLRGIIQKPIMLADLHEILKPFLKNTDTL